MTEIKSNIQVNIEDFRAIDKANIVVDGITVVAGENGSGKSSISKLLYFLYKTVANYDVLVKKNLISSLRNITRFLDIVQQEMRFSDRKLRNEFRHESYELRKNLIASENLEEELRNWIQIINRLETAYDELKDKIIPETVRRNTINRLNHIMKDILNMEDQYQIEKEKGLDISFLQIKDFVQSKFKEAVGKINSRPTSLFIEELRNVFSEGELPKKFEVLEFDDLIVSLKKKDLSIPYSIQNAIYIDTPMVLSIEDGSNIYWDDLNELLLEKGTTKNDQFTKLISNEIIQGDVILEEGIYSADDFMFKRKDGATFHLNDVATGIKSFSILQLLLKKGLLTDKTLLIIDEPESHLHPQWIVEYARLIILLNKEIGVKFFLATHNPDMVSAIRYISEKERSLDKVNFYLAKKSKEKYKFNYKFLDKEIDPIFKSFNIAIDRIDQYGV